MIEPIVHTVRAPMPALVVAILVADDEWVDAGSAVCVTETMKCESTSVAPIAGWMTRRVGVGEIVAADQPLFEIRTVQHDQTEAPHAPRPRARKPPGPAEVLGMLCDDRSAPSFGRPLHPWSASGRFVEHDLPPIGDGDALVPVDRPLGAHTAGLVVGVIEHRVEGHDAPSRRVWIAGDPEESMGSVGEAECRRIIAAFDLAERLGVPVEWVAVSSGARIAWDSGTENMDWCAAVVARIVQFTQAGGSVIVIVSGVCVGAQSYWNAEATMLMHHAGMLVMVDDSSMVLTGRKALELSGGGSYPSELAIGGYDAVMGPNGQAHHVAPDLVGAYELVFVHLTLCEPAAASPPDQLVRRPESWRTSDPADRSVCESPYLGAEGFDDIGDVLEQHRHPTRKRPFAVGPVISALRDADAPELHRWPHLRGGEGAVVCDTRLGGRPVTLIGIESRPLPAGDGSRLMRAGSTLYPEASRKVARALNAASGRRPAVVLASLAGFDGSATSLLDRQLEYGAEIARAVVNFDGPIVVVALGRFHGGAYVVFSRRLNPNVRLVALEGSFVSVIGGDAAAGVVFAGEVRRRAETKLLEMTPSPAEVDALRAELRLAEREIVAREFDAVHSVERAAAVGSVDMVIPPVRLRPAVIELLTPAVVDVRPAEDRRSSIA